MSDQSSRTEKPTQRRLDKAREEGQFPASRELVGAVQFLVACAILGAGITGWMHGFLQLMHQMLAYPFRHGINSGHIVSVSRTLFVQSFVPLMSAGAVLVLVTLIVHLLSTRMGFSLKKLQPDFKRLSSIQKLKNMPRNNMSALFQALFVLIFFGGIVVWLIQRNAELYYLVPLAAVRVGAGFIAGSIGSLLWKAGAVFLVAGVIDYARQHRHFMKDMRMSRQDIQDELKETEGNPLIKARVRRIQRDTRRRRMMSQVATATAVVVNPTHYAVALRYLPESMAAPLVVAKGKNYLALRIKEKAKEHNIPIVENPPVAQALYKSVDVGQEIPPQLYRAVAEILAYLHRLMHVGRTGR